MAAAEEFERQLHTFRKLPPREGRRAAFLFVREVQYGDIGSRDPLDVLREKRGTCSGKHALLHLFFAELGYEVRRFFAVHDFSEFPIQPWPEELREYRGKTITDYHDFLQVRIGNQWIAVDAVFDEPLSRLGFPVQDWDGESAMALPVKAQEIIRAKGNPDDQKKRLIAALPAQVQQDRKRFLSALTAWIGVRRG
jgi:hypothetical protein